MLYFKKAELAETYHVSEKTVTNWIKETKHGKLDLELIQEGSRARIANTTRNIERIERLIEERRKFRNTRAAKVITPKPVFYELYNQRQIFDIASNLDIHREVPIQYGYFDGGASYWDKYVQRLATEQVSNSLKVAIELIQLNQDYLDDLLASYDRVNVIDIGVGNALPVQQLLQYLLDQGKMGSYVGVDTSPSMLKIAKQNIAKWFGKKIPFHGVEADISYDRFAYQLADLAGEEADRSVNLLLVLGGTLANLRSVDSALGVVRDSMGSRDLMVQVFKLDSEATRNYFDFAVNDRAPTLIPLARVILDLLNIEESFYDVEMGYDAELRQRYMRIRLKIELTIEFALENGVRTVELNKNDTILCWRARHQNALEGMQRLEQAGFDVLLASKTEKQDYLLTISRVKCDR